MRTILLSIFLVSCCFYLYAQEATRFLEWNERTLEMEDFQVPGPGITESSNSAITWDVDKRSFRSKVQKNLKIRFVDIRNIFLPEFSWMSTDVRTPEKLQYEQLKFDIAELYSRTSSREGNLNGKADDEVQKWRDSLNLAIGEVKAITQDGSKKESVDSLRQIVSVLLSHPEPIFDSTATPQRRKGVFGMSLSPIMKVRSGGITELLSNWVPAPLISFSFEGAIGRFNLSIGGDIATMMQKSRTAVQYDGIYYPKGIDCDDFNLFVKMGVSVLDNNYLKIYPYLGIGETGLDVPGHDYESIYGFQYLAGICLEYKFWNLWDIDWRTLEGFVMRTQFYVTKDSLAGFNGYSINFGVGIGIFSSKTKKI